MGQRLKQAFLLIGLCLVSCQLFAQSIELKRMSTHNLKPHEWQFSFYLSAPTKYRTFRLKNPDRYVLDLQNVTTKKHLHYKELMGTPIKSLRFSPHKDHIFRIVFDLSMAVNAVVHEVPMPQSGERKLKIVFTRKGHHVAGFDWTTKADAPVNRPSLLRQLAQNNVVTKKKA